MRALVDLISKVRQVFTMSGSPRHMRHARKLAALFRRRAVWRNIGLAHAKASIDLTCAAVLETVCLWGEGKLSYDQFQKLIREDLPLIKLDGEIAKLKDENEALRRQVARPAQGEQP